MLDKLQLCAKNPDILINAKDSNDQKLTDLFLEMTKAFYKSTNECNRFNCAR